MVRSLLTIVLDVVELNHLLIGNFVHFVEQKMVTGVQKTQVLVQELSHVLTQEKAQPTPKLK